MQNVIMHWALCVKCSIRIKKSRLHTGIMVNGIGMVNGSKELGNGPNGVRYRAPRNLVMSLLG